MNLKEIYEHLGITSGSPYLSKSREEILSNFNLSIQDKGKIIFRKPIIKMIEDFYGKYEKEITNIINASGDPFITQKEEYIDKIIEEIPYLTQSFFDEYWQSGSMEDFILETNITPPFYGLVAYINLEKGVIDGIRSIINVLYIYHYYNQNDSSANYIEGTKDLISELSGIHMTVFIMISSIIESPQNTDSKTIEKNTLQDGEGGNVYFPERFIMNNNKLTLSKNIYNHPVLLGEEVLKQQQYMSNMRLKCPAMHSKNKEEDVITFVLHKLFAEHFQKYHKAQD